MSTRLSACVSVFAAGFSVSDAKDSAKQPLTILTRYSTRRWGMISEKMRMNVFVPYVCVYLCDLDPLASLLCASAGSSARLHGVS